MMDNQPKVSILVPAYNCARYVKDTLLSISMQTYGDYEVIISDNASTDNLDEVVSPFIEADSRFRYFRHENNLGMVGNWNWCLQQARGSYLKFLFGDDAFSRKDSLAGYVALMDKNPRASLGVSARLLIDDKSAVTGVWSDLGNSGIYSGEKVMIRCMRNSMHNFPGEPTAAIFRRNAGRGCFDDSYRQLVDLEMWFELLSHGDLAYTNLPLCAFRQHSEQQTELNRKSRIDEIERVNIVKRYFPVLLEKNIGVRRFLVWLALVNFSSCMRDRQLPEGVDLGWVESLAGSRLLWLKVCLGVQKFILHRIRKLNRSIGKRCKRLTGGESCGGVSGRSECDISDLLPFLQYPK